MKEKTSKPKYNMAQNSWFMIKLAWNSGEKKVLVLSLLSAALTLALNLTNLYVSPTILSAVERHSSVAELVWTIAGFVLGILFLSAALAYVDENTLFGRISVRCEIINLLNRKACTTSYPNLDDDRFRKLLTKSNECTNSNQQATEAVWTTLTALTTNLLGFVIYVCLLSTAQPFLILVILATSAAGFFLSNRLNGYGYRHREEEAEYERHIDYIAGMARDLGAAKDIRIFGLRSWFEELHDKGMAAYTAFQRRAQGVYLWAKIADLVLAFLRNGIAYLYLIRLVLHGGLGVAEFLLFFTAAGGFTEWVTGILTECNTLHKQSMDLSTVRECLEYGEPFRFEDGEPLRAEENAPPRAEKSTPPRAKENASLRAEKSAPPWAKENASLRAEENALLQTEESVSSRATAEQKYEIRLENVSFRYPGADKDALTNINLTLHPGEKLAVVGLNGAGKTTLVKLICGFLDPTEGRVLLDGRDIRDFNRTDYYTLFSAVFQNFSLLAGTVAANVAQSETDIDREYVAECVEKAGLRAKIESLPKGYETCLNRNVYEDAILLSGGETQRLMLARALYKNAPFIVLDEPTAALDPIAESDLYQKYNEMTGGRSSVYISHRLASTRFCDRIVMIDNAEIIEEGTHDELLKAGGKYSELYEVQSKYYKESDMNDSLLTAGDINHKDE